MRTMARFNRFTSFLRQYFLVTICGVSMATGFLVDISGLFSSSAAVPLYITAYLSGGYEGLKATLRDLRNLRINIDFLMIAAAAGAAVIGLWLEGAILLFLFSLSEALEDFALGKSRTAIHSLMELRPSEALVRGPDGAEKLVPVGDLVVGQQVIVKPGEYIPIDGQILSGLTDVNQATITGESVPVTKKPGDPVFAGTLNEQGAITLEVSKPEEDSTIANIIRLVEKAQKNRARAQRFLDNFEPTYALVVVISVILLILVPWLILDQEFDPVFYRAMTVLVVASPCALIISTPASIISAIANAAKNGILFKGGAHIEQTTGVDIIALDKTGTLTAGKPVVTDLYPFGNHSPDTLPAVSEQNLLEIAAGCELYSEHHIAEAVVSEAKRKNIKPIEIQNLQAHTGRGVEAEWEGKLVSVGNQKMYEQQIDRWPSALLERADKLKKQGKTVVFVVEDERPLGLIALADQIRPQAFDALKDLRKMGIRKIVMLTGDNEGVAHSIAEKLDIDEVHAALLPEQKLEIIEKLKQEGVVAMVGDGINDAPALAVSHLGIAMGAAGTDVALETADVVLMGDDLSKLPYLLWLSRKARRVVWQNIGFSLTVILLLLTGVFLVDLPLTLGVIGHEGSTLVVVMNGLRLLQTGNLSL